MRLPPEHKRQRLCRPKCTVSAGPYCAVTSPIHTYCCAAGHTLYVSRDLSAGCQQCDRNRYDLQSGRKPVLACTAARSPPRSLFALPQLFQLLVFPLYLGLSGLEQAGNIPHQVCALISQGISLRPPNELQDASRVGIGIKWRGAQPQAPLLAARPPQQRAWPQPPQAPCTAASAVPSPGRVRPGRVAAHAAARGRISNTTAHLVRLEGEQAPALAPILEQVPVELVRVRQLPVLLACAEPSALSRTLRWHLRPGAAARLHAGTERGPRRAGRGHARGGGADRGRRRRRARSRPRGRGRGRGAAGGRGPPGARGPPPWRPRPALCPRASAVPKPRMRLWGQVLCVKCVLLLL